MKSGPILALLLAVVMSRSALAQTSLDDSKTPGTVDHNATDEDICLSAWAKNPQGPPVRGGGDTYTGAARQTPDSMKRAAYEAYGLTDPHDGGTAYEVDHRVPLSLGGRDELRNLWPQSRTVAQFNAWDKDGLEFRVLGFVCPNKARGADKTKPKSMSLQDAQAIFLGDWAAAYQKYCPDRKACPDQRPKGWQPTN
jgi:hypothetical protein